MVENTMATLPIETQKEFSETVACIGMDFDGCADIMNDDYRAALKKSLITKLETWKAQMHNNKQLTQEDREGYFKTEDAILIQQFELLDRLETLFINELLDITNTVELKQRSLYNSSNRQSNYQDQEIQFYNQNGSVFEVLPPLCAKISQASQKECKFEPAVMADFSPHLNGISKRGEAFKRTGFPDLPQLKYEPMNPKVPAFKQCEIKRSDITPSITNCMRSCLNQYIVTKNDIWYYHAETR